MEDYSDQITDYLKTQSWQIAVLVIIVGIVTLVLKNKSAHIRYLLWLIVLAKCLVPPFLTVPLAVLPEPRVATVFPVVEPMAVEPIEIPAAETAAPPVPVVVEHTPRLTIHQWLVIGWIMGVAIFITVAVTKALRTEFWLKRERKPLPTGLQSEIKELFTDLGIRILPKLWLLDGIGQPFVWGLLRGGIYLPANFVDINKTEHRKGILGHELSHVLRLDAAINLLQIIAQAIFWFHPFVWWANRRIRSEREKCCDEIVVARLNTKVKDYSKAIVNTLVNEYKPARPIPSLAIAGSVKNIEERIKTMLKPGKKFYKRPSMPAAVVVILTALLSVPTTVILTARAVDQPTDEKVYANRIFSNPTNLGPTVNSPDYEWDPEISADGLSLYFLSRRSGGPGNQDIWLTTRKTKDDTWGTPVNLGPPVNSSAFEGAPCISADELSLYFVSARPGSRGWTDIWIATRKAKGDPWGEPVNLGQIVNGPMWENNPSLSADGLSLYFSGFMGDNRPQRPGGIGGADIWVTTRENKESLWRAPVNLGSTVNSTYHECSPSISQDGLFLYFNSDRPGFGKTDIWVTTRKSKADRWGTPINLGPEVNTSQGEHNPDISSDGSTLYFIRGGSGAIGGSEDSDIWQASLNFEAKPTKSLYEAASDGDLEQVWLHISNGADVNTKDKDGHTPLYSAILHNKTNIVEMLLSNGADVNCTPEKGFNPLDHAAMFGNLDMATMLIDHGAKCSTTNYLGWTPLRYGVHYGNKEMVELFVAHGADVSGIHQTASLGNVNHVRTLLQKGTNVDVKDELGWTPLHWAALMGQNEVGRVLLSKGARIEAKNDYGYTLLNLVAYGGNLKGAEFLIVNGANVNTRAQNGFTPLHSAAYQGHKEIVELLLTHGADKTLKDRRGRTALTVATNRGHTEIIELLRKY